MCFNFSKYFFIVFLNSFKKILNLKMVFKIKIFTVEKLFLKLKFLQFKNCF